MILYIIYNAERGKYVTNKRMLTYSNQFDMTCIHSADALIRRLESSINTQHEHLSHMVKREDLKDLEVYEFKLGGVEDAKVTGWFTDLAKNLRQ